jgi:tRNA pseudouridine55 synthase
MTLAQEFIAGKILFISKPTGWTSFDVVKKVRQVIKKKLGVAVKTGHAGTLDPLAKGLLIICTGKMTKKIEEFQNLEKEYTGTFIVGATTPSFDMETPTNSTYPTGHITEKIIREAAKKFVGKIRQTPPVFSAKRIRGKRAYHRARRGEALNMKQEEVVIHAFEITKTELPAIEFRVVCSKGTYIRSLAHDFGLEVQSGAYLASLCRTRIGPYLLSQATDISHLEKEIIPDREQTPSAPVS